MSAPIRLRDPFVSSKTYSFNFSFGGLAVLLTAFTLALTVFFVLGVMVGRGQRPENMVPAVARIMPTEAPSKENDEVLRADQLDYARRLSQKAADPLGPQPEDAAERSSDRVAPAVPTSAVPAGALSAGVAPTPAPPAAQGDSAPAPVASKNAAVADAGEKPRKPKIAQTADAEKPDPDSRRYDYAYQVASFPDKDAARTSLKRIKAKGLKADIETGNTNGKVWYRVVVFFRGTPTETRGLKTKLASLGSARPLMRSKTPVR